MGDFIPFQRFKANFDETKNRKHRGEETAAMAGFLARETEATRQLVEMLTKLLYKRVAKQEDWVDQWDELQSRCFAVLVEWRHAGRLTVDEPLPYLAKRILKQVQKQMSGEDAYQENAAEGWIKEPRPAAVKSDQALSAGQLIARVWGLAKGKLSPERVKAIEAWVAEDSGGPPIEATLGMSRESAQKRVSRAQAELWQLAEEAGLLDDVHWEGQGEQVMVETETQEDGDEDENDD